jgi:cell division protein ZapD
VITYEYPLNERIRTLLRLEALFDKALHFATADNAYAHHAALMALFEILEVAGRADLKVDLVQELERQRQTLQAYRDNPQISKEALADVLSEIEQASVALLAMTGKIGQYVRDSEWLMAVRSRAAIPGGLCEFDLPSYHHWLHEEAELRRKDIRAWLAPMFPIRDGLTIVLRLLRESGRPELQLARLGSYQIMMSGRAAQMARVRLSQEQACVPEISANKYAFNIRFVGLEFAARPSAFDKDVSFELTFCNL